MIPWGALLLPDSRFDSFYNNENHGHIVTPDESLPLISVSPDKYKFLYNLAYSHSLIEDQTIM